MAAEYQMTLGHPLFKCRGASIEYPHTCKMCGKESSFASADEVCQTCFVDYWSSMIDQHVPCKNGLMYVRDHVSFGNDAVFLKQADNHGCGMHAWDVALIDKESGTVTVNCGAVLKADSIRIGLIGKVSRMADRITK